MPTKPDPPPPDSRYQRLSQYLLPPVMLGYALGALESAMVLASYSHNLGPGQKVFAVLIPYSVYGLLYWAAGLLIEALAGRWIGPAGGRGRPLLNWAWVLATGLLAVWIFRYRLSTGLTKSLAMAVPPLAVVAVMLAVGWWMYKRGRFQKLSFGLPLVTIVGYLAFLVFVPASGGGHLEARQPSGPAPEGKPNVVLVTWDTVRADTLPVFGGAGLETPELARLVEEGLLLEDFQAVAPVTGPSHASMLTGLYPPSHGLRSNGDMLVDEPNLSLAEHFEEAGYATGGFVSGLPITEVFGFDAGFQAFDGRTYEGAVEKALRGIFFTCSIASRLLPEHIQPPVSATAGEVTLDRALYWLEGTDRPFFFWLHLYDAHSPYRPPEPFASRARDRAEQGPRPFDPDPEVVEDWVMQRGEIERIDDLVAQLLDVVEERDPGLEQTAVVLAADHGECFGEGGFYGHHASLFQATQHVVGVVRPQGDLEGLQRGARSALPTSQVDLFPTIVELAGLEQAPVQGLSLMPLLRGEPGFPERELYLETYTRQLFDSRRRAWRARPWTYGVDLEGAEVLIHDERGEVPLAEADPALLERMRAALRDFLAGVRILESESVDDEDVQQGLEDLGYVELEEEG